MHRVLDLTNMASYVLAGVALLCLIQHANGRNTALLARVAGGLFLCSIGIVAVLPILASPRSTARGVVTGFHEVTGYRSSHFEFRVQENNRLSGVLSANYFDKGFYSNDPSMSDGDTVVAERLDWTNEAVALREVAGRHAGWAFQEDENRVGPWLLIIGGALLAFAGVLGKLSDLAARPDSDPMT